MAQFDFLGSWDDSWKLVDSLLNRPGTTLYLDYWYKEPVRLCIKQLAMREKELLRKHKGVFICGEDFSLLPPQFSKVGNGEVLYRLRENEGGPCLDLGLPACYERDGIINLAHGMFSYSHTYLNPESQQWEPASPQVIAAYKEIQGLFKQHLVRHKFHKYIWTGRHALQLIQSGKARIRGFGLPE